MSTEVLATVSVSVAAAQWDVSEETLLEALDSDPSVAKKGADNTWQIPTTWLDATYDRSEIIDLRDIGSELSTVLDHLLVTRDRLGQAEVRAAVAETEAKFLSRDIVRLEAELVRAEADAEHWMTEHDHREADLVVEQKKVAQSEAAAEQLRFQLAQTEIRLDDTYRDLLKLQSEAPSPSKQNLIGRLRARKRD